MRKLFLIYILLPLISFAQKDGVCVLRGHIRGLGDETLTLSHYVNGADDARVLDTIRARSGSFVYTTHLSEPTYYRIFYYKPKTEKHKAVYYSDVVFLEAGNMAMTGSLKALDKSVVKGSAVNDEWVKISRSLEQTEDSLQKSALARRGSKDKKKNTEIELNQEEQKILSDFIRRYVLAHPQSYSSLQLIRDQYGYDVKPALSGPLYYSLDEKVRGSVMGILFQHQLDLAIKTDTGQKAPEVSLPDTDGKNINLSSFRGKVVLLDFWASWCGPCRRENPNVVKAYHKYHDKGFDIYGVSFDEKKDRWQQAIVKDSLTWTHVSDLKGWQCAAGKTYGIQAIPSNVLIDRQGMIIGKNLRAEDLDIMLEKVFK